METRNKNVLIGGLLAIVLVMAVGYAAFATQLNINGTASIDTSWNVHFDTTKVVAANTTTSQQGKMTITKGSTTATGADPSGSIAFDGDTTANIAATLKSPGDSIEFTLTILNQGSFDATLDSIVMAWDETTSAYTNPAPTAIASGAHSATYGNIKFDFTNPASSLPNTDGTTTMTVTATYVAGDVTTGGTASEGTPITGNVTNTQTAGITITFVYKQA